MSWVDVVVVVLVALGVWRGYAHGALRQVGAFAGFVAGFYVGGRAAPALSTSLTSSAWRPLVALGIVLVAAVAGSALGRAVGSVLGRALRELHVGLVDRVAGAVVGGVGAAIACWMAAGLLSATSWGSLAPAIQNSVALRTLNAVMPPVPAFEARVQALLRGVDFPSVFANLIAPATLAPPPALGPSVANLRGPSSVQKVLATGCASGREGTAFYVGPQRAVTNAHVVAGARRVTVGGVRARVIGFDPRDDLAVLAPLTRESTWLHLSSAAPAPGTPAQVVGFPLDATRTATPAEVLGEVSAQSRDIYNQGLFTRTLVVVGASVEPGNSGSPLLIGRAVSGVIVSKSVTSPDTAYAIPAATVARELARVAVHASAVSTESCLP
ncbi:MAG: CvpA family protein [Acidimicrobiales bacterium]